MVGLLTYVCTLYLFFYCEKCPYLILTNAYVLAGVNMDNQTRIILFYMIVIFWFLIHSFSCLWFSCLFKNYIAIFKLFHYFYVLFFLVVSIVTILVYLSFVICIYSYYLNVHSIQVALICNKL